MPFSDAALYTGFRIMPTSVGIVVLLGLLYALYLRLLPKPIPGIPYDKKSARNLLGDGPDMIREVAKTREIQWWLIKRVNQLQSPICQVFVMPFAKPWVLLADSIEGQNVMTKRPEFDRSNLDKAGLGVLDGYHALLTMGDEWKRHRTWLQDLLTPNVINNTVSPAIYTNSLQLVDLWKAKARLAEDCTFEVSHDLDNAVLDGMLSFMFGREFEHAALGPRLQALTQLDPSKVRIGRNGDATFPEAPANDFVTAMQGAVEAVDIVAQSAWPDFAKVWVRYIPRIRKAIAVRRRVIREQFQAAVRRLEATGEAKTAIEHMLLREGKTAEKQDRKPNYMHQGLLDEVGGQFLAGYHTSAGTLAWTFLALSSYPEIQTKLRDALHTAFDTAHAERRAPSTAELSKTRVPYLDAVIDEILRLHAALITRRAVRNTQIFGYHIPKNTTVVIMCNGPGYLSPTLDAATTFRNKSSEGEKDKGWDETRDMFTFEPERWLRKTEGATTDDAVDFDPNAAPQAAFGLGLRGCWGRKLAYLQLRIISALVVWHFDLLPVPPKLAHPTAALSVIHRADECYVRLKHREDAGDS